MQGAFCDRRPRQHRGLSAFGRRNCAAATVAAVGLCAGLAPAWAAPADLAVATTPVALADAATPGDPTQPGHRAAQPRPTIIELRFGQGLQVAAGDGGSSLQVRAFVRARQSLTDPKGAPTAEALVRNAQLRFSGHALRPGLTWRIQLGLSPTEMAINGYRLLQTALVRYTWTTGWSVAAGRAKVPYGAQRLAHSSELQFTDLSATVQELHLDRTSGIFVQSPAENRADVSGVVAGNSPGFLAGVRARLRPLGAFDDTVEGDVARSPRLRVALAGSLVSAVDNLSTQVTRGEVYPEAWTQTFHTALDFTVKYKGFSLHSEWMSRQAKGDSAYLDLGHKVVRVWSRSAYGAHLQLGQMVNPWVQVAARMARLRRMDGTDPALRSVDELAAAVTAHLRGDDFKVQLEIVDLFSGDFRDGMVTLRGQVALFW